MCERDTPPQLYEYDIGSFAENWYDSWAPCVQFDWQEDDLPTQASSLSLKVSLHLYSATELQGCRADKLGLPMDATHMLREQMITVKLPGVRGKAPPTWFPKSPQAAAQKKKPKKQKQRAGTAALSERACEIAVPVDAACSDAFQEALPSTVGTPVPPRQPAAGATPILSPLGPNVSPLAPLDHAGLDALFDELGLEK